MEGIAESPATEVLDFQHVEEHEYVLEMNKISKAFPGVQALNEVSLKLRPGTIHALLGENGAGKSTLMKVLFGIYRKDSGQILIDGEPVEFTSSKQALIAASLWCIRN